MATAHTRAVYSGTLTERTVPIFTEVGEEPTHHLPVVLLTPIPSTEDQDWADEEAESLDGVVEVGGEFFYLRPQQYFYYRDGGKYHPASVLVREVRGVDYGGNVHRVHTAPDTLQGVSATLGRGSLPLQDQDGEFVYVAFRQ